MDLEAISEPDAGRVSNELREFGLHYTTDEVRGITRRRSGKGFTNVPRIYRTFRPRSARRAA
jgi:hypothetical protein